MLCSSCNSPLRAGQRFCSACGRPAVPAAPPRAAQRGRRKRSLPLILLALLLLVFSLSQMSLGLFGVNTQASVTRIEQRIHIGTGADAENTRDPTRYEFYYRFTAADGSAQSGSVIKSAPHGIAAGADGSLQTITVRYLPFLPHINGAVEDTGVLSGLLFLGFSLLLLTLGISGRIRRAG